MNEKIKEIIASNRQPLPSPRLEAQRLADIVERVANNGGLELKNFTPYSDSEQKSLADAVHDHDKEMSKGFKTSFAKIPENEATKRIFKGRPRMVFDIR
jgi:hypothetical protein